MLQSDKHHLTGKPSKLMAALLQCVPIGALVIDPFTGSGTTIIAAAQTGRRALGIERESEYCRITVDRLRQHAAQPALDLQPAHGTHSQTS